MIRAILVPCNEAASDAPVVGVLAGLVQQMTVPVEPLDHLCAGAGFLAEPDRARQHKNVRGHDLLGNVGPVVFLPAVVGHVGPDAIGDVMVDSAEHLDAHLVLLHDRFRDTISWYRRQIRSGILDGLNAGLFIVGQRVCVCRRACFQAGTSCCCTEHSDFFG